MFSKFLKIQKYKFDMTYNAYIGQNLVFRVEMFSPETPGFCPECKRGGEHAIFLNHGPQAGCWVGGPQAGCWVGG